MGWVPKQQFLCNSHGCCSFWHQLWKDFFTVVLAQWKPRNWSYSLVCRNNERRNKLRISMTYAIPSLFTFSKIATRWPSLKSSKQQKIKSRTGRQTNWHTKDIAVRMFFTSAHLHNIPLTNLKTEQLTSCFSIARDFNRIRVRTLNHCWSGKTS